VRPNGHHSLVERLQWTAIALQSLARRRALHLPEGLDLSAAALDGLQKHHPVHHLGQGRRCERTLVGGVEPPVGGEQFLHINTRPLDQHRRVHLVANELEGGNYALQVFVAVLLVVLERLHEDGEHRQPMLVSGRLLEGGEIGTVPVDKVDLFQLVGEPLLCVLGLVKENRIAQ